MAEIIMITSGKGGVGKSTVSLLTGAALARRGKKVLLIEMDAGLGGLDILMGVQDKAVFDLSDVLRGRCEPIKAIVHCPYRHGLDLIIAPRDEGCELGREPLTKLCRGLSHYYDVLLIDAPGGIGCGFEVGAAVSARAVIVVTPDPVSVRDGRVVSDRLDRVGLRTQRLIINRLGEKFLRQHLFEDLDEVIDGVGAQLLGVVLEDPEILVQTAKGQPLSQKARSGKVFDAIAGRLLGEDIPLVLSAKG